MLIIQITIFKLLTKYQYMLLVFSYMYVISRNCLMASALVPEWSGTGSNPGWGHSVVPLTWARHFYFHSASLHPGV